MLVSSIENNVYIVIIFLKNTLLIFQFLKLRDRQHIKTEHFNYGYRTRCKCNGLARRGRKRVIKDVSSYTAKSQELLHKIKNTKKRSWKMSSYPNSGGKVPLLNF